MSTELARRLADAGRANLLNVVNVPVFLAALYSAYRQQPGRTAAFTASRWPRS